MESVIGKRWSEIGSIDWEGNCPVLDRELRVVRVVPFDALGEDESFVPVDMVNDYLPSRASRTLDYSHDAYMARIDFDAFHGMLAGVAEYDLCEDSQTESRIARAFPLWAESGAIPSHFSVVTREAWDSARVKMSEYLLRSATDQIDRGYFTAADDFLDPHIAEEEGGALVAYFHADGEPVCCLVGCISDALK